MITRMKRSKILVVLFAIFALSCFVMPTNIYADDACDVAGIDDPLICGSKGGDEETELMQRISNTLRVVYLWTGIISVVCIIIGGINYMTSLGESEKIKRAKNTIMYSLCGLIVTLSAFALTTLTINAIGGSTTGGGEGGGSESPGLISPRRDKVQSIMAVDETTVAAGSRFTIKAKIVPDYAKNKKISYKSSDTSIATVDREGVVKTLKTGDVTITLYSSDGPTKDVKIHVSKPIPVREIKLSTSSLKLKKDKTATITATIVPREASDRTLTWSSANSKVATVDQKGVIKAIRGGSTTITATARNNDMIAQKPGKMALAAVTLAAAESNAVTAEVKVEVEGDSPYSTQASTANQKFSGRLDFRPETRKIVDQHLKDFKYSDYANKIKAAGGYTSYVRKLGGIFGAYAGDSNKFNVTSAADPQAAAEYVWGLWTIWGADYDNGANYKQWGNGANDGFYDGSNHRYAGAGYSTKSIDATLASSQKVRTNGNWGIDTFTLSTKLPYIMSERYKYQANLSGKIQDTGKLQVGDLIHFFRNNGDWSHVAIVGEVYSDYVVIYDGGSRFVTTKYFKKKIKRGGNKLTDNYAEYGTNWYGTRPWTIDQSKTLEGLK